MLIKSVSAGLLATAVAFTIQYVLRDDWTAGISSSIATGVALFGITLWYEWKRSRGDRAQKKD